MFHHQLVIEHHYLVQALYQEVQDTEPGTGEHAQAWQHYHKAVQEHHQMVESHRQMLEDYRQMREECSRFQESE